MGDKKIAWKVLLGVPKGKRALARPTRKKQRKERKQDRTKRQS